MNVIEAARRRNHHRATSPSGDWSWGRNALLTGAWRHRSHGDVIRSAIKYRRFCIAPRTGGRGGAYQNQYRGRSGAPKFLQKLKYFGPAKVVSRASAGAQAGVFFAHFGNCAAI